MRESGLSEDYCRCGHVASAHTDGEAACRVCRADGRAVWSMHVRCHRFEWSARWQTDRSA